MAKLVDAQSSGGCVLGRAGSSPALGTERVISNGGSFFCVAFFLVQSWPLDLWIHPQMRKVSFAEQRPTSLQLSESADESFVPVCAYHVHALEELPARVGHFGFGLLLT